MKAWIGWCALTAVLVASGCGGSTKTPPPPQTAPTVTSVTPANGATGVATAGTTVTATFSEAMNQATITTSTFTLTGPSGAVSGTVTYSGDTATFTPSASLDYGTQYTATITTGAASSGGTALAANYTWSFTTASAPAPTVASVTPTNGATGVATAGTTVTATFSEAMNQSTITMSTFTLTGPGGTAVGGVVTYSGDTAVFTPSASLAYDTQYTATLTTGVQAANGAALAANYSWTFTTALAPAPAPTVVSVTPVNGSNSATVATTITATFSEAMNAATINTSTFMLEMVVPHTGLSQLVSGTVTYNASNMVATFTPSANLDYGTQYTATITTGATSSGGIAMATSYIWNFTTEAAPVPTVTSTVPASGATDASVSAALTAAFNEAMDASTITASTFTLTGPSNTAVAGTVTYNSSTQTATFAPNAALDYSTSYTATITTGAESSAGAALASNYTWTFTTGANPDQVTVDFGTTYQTIRGFGGSTAWLGTLTTQQATALFNPTSGLGLSILRMRIDPEGSASGGGKYGDPYETSQWDQELANAQEAYAANPNAIVFATPWTPPATWKLNGNSSVTNDGVTVNQTYNSSCGSEGTGYCGGYLNPSDYGNYANYLEDFVNYFDTNSGSPNLTLYAISMQNEPEENVSYESCVWTPAEMDAFVASLTAGGAADPITTKLMMPESAVFNPDYSTPTLEDASAVNNVSIVGGHLYATGESPDLNPTSASTILDGTSKDVWATEHYLTPSGGFGAQPTISDALDAAEEVHSILVTGQYNAYVWWWIWDDPYDGVNYGLINSSTTSPAPTYYGYAIGQFSKFIQPGFVRVSATANPSSGVYVSAYTYTGSIAYPYHYVIVAINAGTSAPSLTFTLQNGSGVTSLTPYQTTSTGGLVQQPAVSVSGGQFTYTLPAQSITTLVQ